MRSCVSFLLRSTLFAAQRPLPIPLARGRGGISRCPSLSPWGEGQGEGGVGLSTNSAMARPSDKFQRLLETIRKPRAQILLHDDAVHDDVDVVLELLVELGRVADVVDRAVDLDALIALLLPLGDFLAVLALAAAHDRRQDQEPRALGQRQHAIDHLR